MAITESANTHVQPNFIVAVVPSEEYIDNPLPFNIDDIYIISDMRPYIDFQFNGHIPKIADSETHREHTLESIPQRSGWARWNLATQLSADRRMGRYELALKVPKNTTLRCYVIPEKLISVAGAWSMIEEIEQELDRPVAWSEDRRRATRSWVQGERHSSRSITVALLDEVDEELASAQALRRNPPLEPSRSGRRLAPAPELTLIAHWAIQRGHALSLAVERLEQELKDLERRQQEHHPKKRWDVLAHRQRDVQAEQDRARSLHSLILQQIDTSEFWNPVQVGPLAQRDFRFRQLLRAFAPRTSEIATQHQGRWSKLPPLSLNRLFECWGAVWLVKQLRMLGFQGGVDKTLGSNDVTGCTFVLQRDDVRVALDFEPHPARLDLTDLPALDDRLVSSEEWAIERQFTDSGRPFFGSQDSCSPDYLLRIEGPGRAVFAIGDACLADPCHHKDDKLETLRAYRRSILWKSGNGVVRCEPLGLFALYPGPTSRWQSLEPSFRKDDVWLLCPEARSSDEHAQQRVSRMLTHLLTTAMGTSARQANR
jgi:hypothetical protein